MLSQTLLAKVICATKEYEGMVAHMYLDSKGLVTVGVGFYLPSVKSAMAYDFITADGIKATAQQIEQGYLKVSIMEPDCIATFYQRPDSLLMEDVEINRVLTEHIYNNYNELSELYEHFETFPDGVKLALLDMIFNLGFANLKSAWPHFNKAVLNQDWQEAAVQSHRRAPVSDARNEYVSQLLLGAVNKPD